MTPEESKARYEAWHAMREASGVKIEDTELEAEVHGHWFYADILRERIYVHATASNRLVEIDNTADEDGIVPWAWDEYQDEIIEALNEQVDWETEVLLGNI